MKVEQVLELVKAVSDSELTEFKYEEDGVKLSLKKTSDKIVQVPAPAAPVAAPVIAPAVMPAAPAPVPAGAEAQAADAEVPAAAENIIAFFTSLSNCDFPAHSVSINASALFTL